MLVLEYFEPYLVHDALQCYSPACELAAASQSILKHLILVIICEQQCKCVPPSDTRDLLLSRLSLWFDKHFAAGNSRL